MGGVRLLAASLAIGIVATAARGQDYPAKPITLVNPYAAGGPADLLARTVAAGMSDLLGQQIVILNKPGGATAIGAQHVATSAPDGYTLLIAGASSHIVTPALTKLTYDGIKDFAPVAMVANVPNVLVVRPSLPVKSVPELIALAKSKPGTLNYGSVGNGSQPHLAAEMFKQMAGVDFTHLPYKGAAPAITDLLGGADRSRLPERAAAAAAYPVGQAAGARGHHDEAGAAASRSADAQRARLDRLRRRHLVRDFGAGRDARSPSWRS